jgi:hypothetical protein
VALATYLAREKMIGAESRFRPFIEVCPWHSLPPCCDFATVLFIFETYIRLKHPLYF